MSMADKVEFLENNRVLLRTMGEKAHKVIAEKSNMDRHIEFWESLFRK